jgi:hypothetical protein
MSVSSDDGDKSDLKIEASLNVDPCSSVHNIILAMNQLATHKRNSPLLTFSAHSWASSRLKAASEPP